MDFLFNLIPSLSDLFNIHKKKRRGAWVVTSHEWMIPSFLSLVVYVETIGETGNAVRF